MKAISVLSVGEPIEINLESDVIDLRTVQSASLQVQKTDYSEVEWVCQMSNATETTLTLTYVVQDGDVLEKPTGSYHAYAELVLASGPPRVSEVFVIKTKGPFDLS